MITDEILKGIGEKNTDLGIKITVKSMIVIIAKSYELFSTTGKGLFQAIDLKSFLLSVSIGGGHFYYSHSTDKEMKPRFTQHKVAEL